MMALTSYPAPKTTTSLCIFDHGGTADWISSIDNFTVTPSPCHNGTGRTRPGSYSFRKSFERRMFGYLNSGYYWGNPGSRKFVPNGSHGNVSGLLTPNPPPFTGNVVLANAKDAARNRALSKIYSEIKSSEVNLSTTIGEGRETLRMMAAVAEAVKHPLDALTSLVKRPRKGRSGQVARSSSLTVSNLWLGWQVGLKPLLHDLESLSLHLKTDKSLDIRYYKKARASEEVQLASSSKGSGGQFDYDQFASYRSEIGVMYQVVDMHAFENWRLGLTVRPTLAWELTRLSFVVDYFVEIGTFLETLEAAIFNNGLQFNGGFESSSSLEQTRIVYTREAESSGDGGALTGTTWPVLLGGHATGYTRTTSKSRSELKSFPVSRTPNFKIPRSGAQLLTVAALLSQFLK